MFELDHEQRGDGAPVVLVHGDISDRRTWRDLAPLLATHRRVLTYSRRGHWPDPPPAPGEGSGVARHAADLAAFLERVAGGRADIVANSYGAYVALVLAKERPHLVRALVLEEPAVVPLAMDLPPTPEGMRALAERDPALAQAMGELLDRCVGPAIGLYAQGKLAEGAELFARYHVPEAIARDAETLDRARDNAAPHAAGLLVGDHFAPFSEADARAVTAPTLLVTGERSPPYLPLLSERLAKLMPRAEWARMRGVGHFMHAEAPEDVARLVEAFLAGAATRARAGGS